MIYVLDTDTFSNLMRGDPAIRLAVQRHSGDVFLSIVALREYLRGVLAVVSAAEAGQGGRGSLPEALSLLELAVKTAAQFPILPFDDSASALFQSWPKSVHRIGPNDCRISASAIIHGAVVVTSNLSDYRKIAEYTGGAFHTEDWRAASSA